jgi:hypothetical protein
LVGGALLWLTFKAIAEVLHVVMDIEENTRKGGLLSAGSPVIPNLDKVAA